MSIVTALRDRESELADEPQPVRWDERPIAGAGRGLPWWGAILLGFGLAVLSAVIDLQFQDKLGRLFQGGYFIGAVAAVAWVQRRYLFGPMVQPPLILAVTVPGVVLLSSGSEGESDLLQMVLDVSTPLINGFPTMAITTVVTLGIGVVRMYRERDPLRSKSDSDNTPRPAKPKKRLAGTDPEGTQLVSPADLDEPRPRRGGAAGAAGAGAAAAGGAGGAALGRRAAQPPADRPARGRRAAEPEPPTRARRAAAADEATQFGAPVTPDKPARSRRAPEAEPPTRARRAAAAQESTQFSAPVPPEPPSRTRRTLNPEPPSRTRRALDPETPTGRRRPPEAEPPTRSRRPVDPSPGRRSRIEDNRARPLDGEPPSRARRSAPLPPAGEPRQPSGHWRAPGEPPRRTPREGPPPAGPRIPPTGDEAGPRTTRRRPPPPNRRPWDLEDES